MSHLSSTSLGFAVRSPCSASGYSASCSSFQPSIGSASQWLSQRPDVFFRPRQIFPFLTAWFPVRSLRFCLFSFAVRFCSLLPDSLPQPFLRCANFLPVLPFHLLTRPCVRSLSAFLSVRISLPLPFVSSGLLPFCFHPASFPPQSFRFAPVRLGLRYLASVSSFPFFKLPPHRSFRSALHVLRFLSVASFASFSSFSPFTAVPFRFLWFPSFRIWYLVLLLFRSPLQVSPHSGFVLSPSHLLRFGPSP